MRTTCLGLLGLFTASSLLLQTAALPPGFEDEGILHVTDPVDVAFVDTFTMLIVTKGGTLFSFDLEDPDATKKLALDLSDRVCTNGERGYVTVSTSYTPSKRK